MFACPVCLTELAVEVERPCCRDAFAQLALPIPELVSPEVWTSSVYQFEMKRYEEISVASPRDYAGYDDSHPGRRAVWLARRLAQAGVLSYVNVGPGLGWLEELTPELESVSLDFCPGFLERTRQTAPWTHPVRAVAERLPFVNYTVECLVSDCTFQSLVDRERFLYEAWRVTAPGALFVFTVLTSWNYPRRPQNGFDVRFRSGRELLKKFLEELEFSVLEERASIARDGDYLIWTCRKAGSP